MGNVDGRLPRVLSGAAFELNPLRVSATISEFRSFTSKGMANRAGILTRGVKTVGRVRDCFRSMHPMRPYRSHLH